MDEHEQMLDRRRQHMLEAAERRAQRREHERERHVRTLRIASRIDEPTTRTMKVEITHETNPLVPPGFRLPEVIEETVKLKVPSYVLAGG
jgi:hypothetical protein